MKCKVCDNEFEPLKDNKYIAKDINIITKTETFYDCFDCPKCGCQVIAHKRMENASACIEIASPIDREG